MPGIITNKFIFLLIPAFMLLSCRNNQPGPPMSVIPQPARITEHGSNCEVPLMLHVNCSQELLPVLDVTSPQFLKVAGVNLVADTTFKGFTLVLKIAPSKVSSGGYSLDISRRNIIINANAANGIFYGMQSLMQLFTEANTRDGKSTFSIPQLHIEDQPEFQWRGMHLDVARHFFPVSEVKQYIDLMAMYKLNIFHWHLTDDQGWRIEIKKYPKLARIAAWREDRTSFPWSYDMFPAIEGKPVYGGFYTQEEIKDIVDYAAKRYITIVPEIEMPGHSWAVLYACPELSCSGKPYFRAPDQAMDFTDPYCAGNEKTFEFIENVLDEVMELFPSQYIHIGGDEAKKGPWEKCAKCRKRMVREGLENVQQLQGYFMQRIETYVKSKGRKIIGWDEILEGGLPPEAAVMSWRGEEGGFKAAVSQHYAVMTPYSFTYLNYGQSVDAALPYDITTLGKTYSYDPVPKELSPQQKKFILGVQGCLWTEYIQNMKMAEYQLLPRMLALSETGWTPAENKDYSRFLQKLPLHYRILEGKNYYIFPPSGISEYETCKRHYRLQLTNPMGYGEIRFTTDNEEPGKDSKLFKGPVLIRGSHVIKATIILPDGRQSNTITTHLIKSVPFDAIKFRSAKNPVSGIDLSIYEGDIESLDQLSSMTLIKKIVSLTLSIPEDVPEDLFALDFKGYLFTGETGMYHFTLRSDDGSRLYINDSLILDNDGVHSIQQLTSMVSLRKGYHPVEIRYFDRYRSQSLEVLMGFSHNEDKSIPATVLFRAEAR
jgi:hexosaminidase